MNTETTKAASRCTEQRVVGFVPFSDKEFWDAAVSVARHDSCKAMLNETGVSGLINERLCPVLFPEFYTKPNSVLDRNDSTERKL